VRGVNPAVVAGVLVTIALQGKAVEWSRLVPDVVLSVPGLALMDGEPRTATQ
jgi:hypothetical protein